MKRNVSYLLLLFCLGGLSACAGSGQPAQQDTVAGQPPLTPPPVDTADMVQPLPADSQHLKMPVKPLPEGGNMPVKEPEPGVVPQ